MTGGTICETCGGSGLIAIYICDEPAGEAECPDCADDILCETCACGHERDEHERTVFGLECYADDGNCPCGDFEPTDPNEWNA
jgi:hypothetical protein